MLEKRVGVELRSLSNQIMRYLDKHSHKKCIDSITGTNGWIIGYIARNDGRDVYQRDLERHFGVTRSTASKVVNLMVRKGLLERQSVPHDARLKKLVLTPRARELSALMEEDGRALEAALTNGFSPGELETLFGFLERLKQNLQ